MTTRISSIVVFTLFAGTSMAFAAPDTPVTVNGLKMVCTGVGSDKDNPRWDSFPVKLVFANTAGEDLAGEHVELTKDGHSVIQTDCDAPWLLLRAPAGAYKVTATIQDDAGTRSANGRFVANDAGAQKTVTLEFPTRQPG